MINLSVGSIKSAYNRTTSALNPMNWYRQTINNFFLDSTPQQHEAFMRTQSDFARQNRSWYPFTNYNPMDSWWSKVKLALFGESVQSYQARMDELRLANNFYDSTIRVQAMESSVQPLTSTVGSGMMTPAHVGLGLKIDPIDPLELARSLETQRILAQSPTVPSTLPGWLGTPEASTSVLPEVKITPSSPVQSDNVSDLEEVVREGWTNTRTMPSADAATTEHAGVNVEPGSTVDWAVLTHYRKT